MENSKLNTIQFAQSLFGLEPDTPIAHEFSCQYIFKRRQQEKTVVLPKLETVKKSIIQSLEELGIDVPEFNDWKELWLVVKKSKVKYRFPMLSKYESSPFSKNYKRRYQIIYEF